MWEGWSIEPSTVYMHKQIIQQRNRYDEINRSVTFKAIRQTVESSCLWNRVYYPSVVYVDELTRYVYKYIDRSRWHHVSTLSSFLSVDSFVASTRRSKDRLINNVLHWDTVIVTVYSTSQLTGWNSAAVEDTTTDYAECIVTRCAMFRLCRSLSAHPLSF